MPFKFKQGIFNRLFSFFLEMFRAGSPFSGKFVLFKPVLFVQVMPVECDGCWNLEIAVDFRLTSRLEEIVTGSALGGGASSVLFQGLARFQRRRRLGIPPHFGPPPLPPFASRSISRVVASQTVCLLEV